MKIMKKFISTTPITFLMLATLIVILIATLSSVSFGQTLPKNTTIGDDVEAIGVTFGGHKIPKITMDSTGKPEVLPNIFTPVADDPPYIKIFAGYISTSNNLSAHSFILPIGSDDAQGYTIQADYRILYYDSLRLGGTVEFSRSYYEGEVKTNQFLAGPQLSYSFYKNRLSPFARAQFGATRNGASGNHLFTKSFGFGLDVNAGHIFVRPIFVDFQYVESLPARLTRIGTGIGIQF